MRHVELKNENSNNRRTIFVFFGSAKSMLWKKMNS